MAFDDNEKDLTDDDNPDCVCTATAYADSQGAYSPGKYYYVWLEMGEFLGIDAPVGTIRLLWEGNETYTEGNEQVQDPPHNFYMGDVADGYEIRQAWNNEDSMIYDGTSLRYMD